MPDLSIPLLAILALLLFLSAAASALETAHFSLSEDELKAAHPRTQKLLATPRSLLVTILISNLVVNILFYAFARQIDVGGETWAVIVRDLAALFVVVFAAEVVPKTIALRARITLARWSSLPLTGLVSVCRPLQRLFDRAIELFYRALGPAAEQEAGITEHELALALEKSAEQGFLLDSEAEILSGIVELEGVRVREIMTPRVDMLFLDKSGADREEVVSRALGSKTPWLVVIDGDPDRIVGRVRLRDLLKHPERSLEAMLARVHFVPEVASALAALRDLRDSRVAQGVAVDEWGGTAGLVTLEDIFEQVVGDLRVEGEAVDRAVAPLGDGRFRVSGRLSIRDWNQHFGRRVVATEFDTVAGLVTALLGRIPRVDDEVRVGGLGLRVHSLRGRRIHEVDLRTLEPEREVRR